MMEDKKSSALPKVAFIHRPGSPLTHTAAPCMLGAHLDKSAVLWIAFISSEVRMTSAQGI